MAGTSSLPRPLRGAARLVTAPVNAILSGLEDAGEQLSFYLKSLGWVWRTLISYKKEVVRLIAEVSLGSGGLALIGGSVGVVAFLTFFTGTEVGLEGYQGLQQIGISAFAGFISAYFNTREIAPIVAGLALGAMRISEEIDALEVMGIPSIPYLVTTRLIAGLVAVIPLYIVGLVSSYVSTRLIVTLYFHQSGGTYDHYFHTFLVPTDVFYSFVKIIIFAIVIMLIHCYYGYYASGGPAGVGVAVGRAVRTSIVAINVIDLFLSLAIWGATTTVRIA
jgi:phospholipid/cholesterol/gamma-HCH transport system permease protein